MSDRRLRELEQAWLATRDGVLEQQLVQAQLRAGTLPHPRLLLAAYAGSSAALQVLGDRGFPEERNLYTWIRGLGKGRLARYPEQVRESAVRVADAAVSYGVAQLEAKLDPGSWPVDEFAVTKVALATWLECPCEAHAGALDQHPPKQKQWLAFSARDLLSERGPQADPASNAARVVKDVAGHLRGVVPHQLKALRRETSARLIEWALVEPAGLGA